MTVDRDSRSRPDQNPVTGPKFCNRNLYRRRPILHNPGGTRQQIEQIANTPVRVNADSYYYYSFKVPPGARDSIVQGHFRVAGGTGNEIEAYILRKDDFEGWWNGEQRPTIYQSGKAIQSTIEARLPAGDVYYLVLSNQVSQASSKVVWIDVRLTYNL